MKGMKTFFNRLIHAENHRSEYRNSGKTNEFSLKTADETTGKTVKRKKGFSLAETVIALSLITVVFMMAMTTLLAVASNYKKISNTSFFTNEITNYLDCYKKGGSQQFKQNVNKFMFEEEKLSGAGGNGKYVFCYDSGYNLIGGYFALDGETFENGYKNDAKYFLHVEINKNFYAYAVDDEDKSITKMQKAFYSRYDL